MAKRDHPHWSKTKAFAGRNTNCYYCKRKLQAFDPNRGDYVTRDHVFPKSKGGRAIVKACLRCNNLKADKDPMDFMEEWDGRWDQMPEWKMRHQAMPQEEAIARVLCASDYRDGTRVADEIMKNNQPLWKTYAYQAKELLAQFPALREPHNATPAQHENATDAEKSNETDS